MRPPYPVECFAQGVLGGSRATASQGEWPWCSRQCGESRRRHVIIRSPGGRGGNMSTAGARRASGAHRRVGLGWAGASAGGVGGRARGCETRYGAVRFRRGRDAVNERPRRSAVAHGGSPGKGLAMQVEFERCLGLCRAGEGRTSMETRGWSAVEVSQRKPQTVGWRLFKQRQGPGTNSSRQGRGHTAQAVVWPSQISPGQNGD